MTIGNFRSLTAWAALALLAVVAVTAVAATDGRTASADSQETFIVVARGNDLPPRVLRGLAGCRGDVTTPFPQIGVAVVKGPANSFAACAERAPGVRSAIPDFKVGHDDPTSVVPAGSIEDLADNPPDSGDDDEYFDFQWGHDAIDAPEAWDLGHRGDGVRVAVLDTAIDADHPDLASNLNTELSKSFVDGDPFDPPDSPDLSHGTHVAGTIAAADNGQGSIGVAPEAEIVGVEVLDESGSGSFAGVLRGIVYAASIDADVINMSLGMYERLDNREALVAYLIYRRVANYAFQQGSTVVAAAGNSAIDLDSDGKFRVLPAELPTVVSVSATGPIGWAVDPDDADLDHPASYSNYGVSAVNFAGPGGNDEYEGGGECTIAGETLPCGVFDMVLSTTTGGWAWAQGTSMATPHVSGVAALIIGKAGGEMAPIQVMKALKDGAEDLGDPGADPFYGIGRVNALNSLE
ncbi:MAG: S8 family serine peptidase, partial [Chloroflexota bacterium]